MYKVFIPIKNSGGAVTMTEHTLTQEQYDAHIARETGVVLVEDYEAVTEPVVDLSTIVDATDTVTELEPELPLEAIKPAKTKH